jgi:hypothetical protein
MNISITDPQSPLGRAWCTSCWPRVPRIPFPSWWATSRCGDVGIVDRGSAVEVGNLLLDFRWFQQWNMRILDFLDHSTFDFWTISHATLLPSSTLMVHIIFHICHSWHECYGLPVTIVPVHEGCVWWGILQIYGHQIMGKRIFWTNLGVQRYPILRQTPHVTPNVSASCFGPTQSPLAPMNRL